jgi:hypothetical protein
LHERDLSALRSLALVEFGQAIDAPRRDGSPDASRRRTRGYVRKRLEGLRRARAGLVELEALEAAAVPDTDLAAVELHHGRRAAGHFARAQECFHPSAGTWLEVAKIHLEHAASEAT